MNQLLFVLSQKLAIGFAVTLTAFGGLLSAQPAAIAQSSNPSSQTAIIAVQIATTTGPIAALPVAVPVIVPGLLPTTTIPFCATGAMNSACHPKKTAKVIAPTVAVTAAAKQPMTPPTAQSILAGAEMKFLELLDGPYKITLANAAANISWPIEATSVGGAAGVPRFASSFSCNPAPGVPVPGDLNQSPIFYPGHAYDCTVSLTPLSGNDQRTQSKDFSFTVPAGQLVVAAPQTMDALLADGINNGGIVFNNKDAAAVTITQLTFDVSSVGLDIQNHPIIIRFLDPQTNSSLYDYHLTNTSGNQSDVVVNLSFMIPTSTQKMLPIEILGVQRIMESGTSPTLTITTRNVTTNRSEIPVSLLQPNVAWTCIVPSTGFDPNATSGPYAAGTACPQ